MRITDFGRTASASLFTFEKTMGGDKYSVSVTNAGAALQSLVFDGVDTVLGFNSAEEYLTKDCMMCTLVGRYAGRIPGAVFTLDGKKYRLDENGKGASIHGGSKGFSSKIWDVEKYGGDFVTFSLFSPDGDMGYPSGITVKITYKLEKGGLFITTEAVADGNTVFNPTLHTYFNLNSDSQTPISDSRLTVYASRYTPLKHDLTLACGLETVSDTPYDFREPHAVGDCIFANHPQTKIGNGLDTSFALDKGLAFGKAASLTSPEGLTLDVFTDRAAVTLYSSNYLDEKEGKTGPLFPRQGLAVETQMLPDSVHHPDFPSTVLKKGEKYRSVTAYIFSHSEE